MSQKDFIEKNGSVIETLPGGKFILKLEPDGIETMGYVSGKMRKNNIKILLGDRVKLEFSPYDPKNGRIVYRYKPQST